MTVSYPDDVCASAPCEVGGLISVGDIVGPYRLVRLLGEGSTGRVFEVEHMRIGRRAAMKIVHSDTAVAGAVKRMFAEAAAVNAIGNPHIVEITDLLVPGYGQPVHALVMEILEGKVLADVISDRNPLPASRLLPILAQTCEALSAVHAAGFIHRDLKPENVFLIERDSKPDFVKLLDFGLVKAIRPDAQSPRATADGTFVGSPAYASPEQATAGPVDSRTDIYAVGVMAYELLTGQLPFEGASASDVLMKQVRQPPPRLPDHLLSTEVGRVLDATIQTCLAKDPEQRVIPATQLAEMFWKLASGTSLPSGSSNRERVAARRLRTIVPVVAAAAVALVVGTKIGTSQPSRPWAHAAGVTSSTARPATSELQAAPVVEDRSHELKSTATPKTNRQLNMPRARRRATPVAERIDKPTMVAPLPERIARSATLDPYQ